MSWFSKLNQFKHGQPLEPIGVHWSGFVLLARHHFASLWTFLCHILVCYYIFGHHPVQLGFDYYWHDCLCWNDFIYKFEKWKKSFKNCIAGVILYFQYFLWFTWIYNYQDFLKCNRHTGYNILSFLDVFLGWFFLFLNCFSPFFLE